MTMLRSTAGTLALTAGSCHAHSSLCTIQLFRVDWQHEADAAAAQQRTIDSLEAGIAAGGDPELLLDAAEAEDVVEQGAQGLGRKRRAVALHDIRGFSTACKLRIRQCCAQMLCKTQR